MACPGESFDRTAAKSLLQYLFMVLEFEILEILFEFWVNFIKFYAFLFYIKIENLFLTDYLKNNIIKDNFSFPRTIRPPKNFVVYISRT